MPDTELFIPCTPMALPEDMALTAMETAVLENPTNRPGTIAVSTDVMAPQFLAFITQKYWSSKGVRLTVGFMEATSPELMNRILAHMNAWDEFCNVRFALTNVDPQVRITRGGQGYWSYLGTDILHIPANQPTMCLQGFTMSTPEREYVRVVRHETGHTLGCPHEHMRREIVQRIDPQKAIQYFRQTQGWSATTVQQQVLTPIEESALMGTPHADEISIMAYNLPGSITVDGNPVVGGADFSQSDREFAAVVYPDEVTPKPPPVNPPPTKPPASTDRVTSVVILSERVIEYDAPSGWTARPKPKNLTGEIEMTKKPTKDEVGMAPTEQACTPSVMFAMAGELEAVMPTDFDVDAAKGAGILTLFTKVSKLVASLKAGDWTQATADFWALVDELRGPTTSGDPGTIHFSQQAAAFKFNWTALIAILAKLFPMVLGG